MTDDYIESSCGLYNGVRFEVLQVDTIYEDNTPKIYKVFAAYLGRIDESKTKDFDRIYLNDPSEKYIWWTDTTATAVYHKRGIYRERIDIKENVQPYTSNEVNVVITNDSVVTYGGKQPNYSENYSLEKQFVCPINFKPETWYYLNFYNQRYEAYLYIDKNMNYQIEKLSLPTNF